MIGIKLKRHFRWEKLLTLLFVSNTLERIEGQNFIGYRRYYVLGFKVAEVQQTKPWQ
jgi:hypothetical protein